MSRLGLSLHLRQHNLLITSATRHYARRAPASRPSRRSDDLQLPEGLAGLEDVPGIEGLARLKDLAAHNPAEAARRIAKVQGLAGADVLQRLGELEEHERRIASSFHGTLKNADFSFPDLMTPDPTMDTHQRMTFPPTKRSPLPGSVVLRNEESLVQAEKERSAPLHELAPTSRNPDAEAAEEDSPLTYLPFTKPELARLHRFPLVSRRVTQQTGKGQVHRVYSLIVVGNGDGLVGYGEGKDDDAARAADKAFAEAVRRMDAVARFERRTLWTDMDAKLGATRVVLRPRPVGFGLACSPNIHQVLKAAGIKDASAKVWGSRNPINVIKALFRMIHAGNAPLSMGNGTGGGAKKLDRGSGARGKESVERERGRRLVDLRTW